MGNRHEFVCAILIAVAIGGSLSLAKAQGAQSQPTRPASGGADDAWRAELDTTRSATTSDKSATARVSADELSVLTIRDVIWNPINEEQEIRCVPCVASLSR